MPDERYKSGTTALPRRGEKDFEQHGLQSQDAELLAARQAMHEALSFPRVHRPGTLRALFDPADASCWIPEPRGPNLQNIGRNDSSGQLTLHPEEALYLLERGTLYIAWSLEHLTDLPLSLENAYSCFVGSQGLTLERYLVYAGLKRDGYIVQRAPTWDPADHELPVVQPCGARQTLMDCALGVFSALYSCAARASPRTSLLRSGLYHSYSSVYKRLRIVPFHDPRVGARNPSLRHSPIRPAFYVWKPTPSFRKTAPPAPDYQICVLDALEDSMPTLDQVEELMQRMPYTPPPEASQGKTYVRLRHGYRKFIIAVVQQGIVSYVSLTDSGFGCEPVYNRGLGRGGKSSSRGRGRGRGGRR